MIIQFDLSYLATAPPPPPSLQTAKMQKSSKKIARSSQNQDKSMSLGYMSICFNFIHMKFFKVFNPMKNFQSQWPCATNLLAIVPAIELASVLLHL